VGGDGDITTLLTHTITSQEKTLMDNFATGLNGIITFLKYPYGKRYRGMKKKLNLVIDVNSNTS